MKYAIDKTVYVDKDEITEVKAIEHDTKTRFINFKFVGNNTAVDLTDCKVRVYAKNSRYIEIFNDLTVLDARKGIAQLELTDKMLRLGITEYQLKIMPMGGGQLSSNTMQIVVGKDLMKDTAIESSNEYKTFENALNKIDKYDTRLLTIENNINHAFIGHGVYNAGTDLNTLVENGAYEISEITHCTNGITDDVYNWGTLTVFNCNKVNGVGQRITQVYYPHVNQDGHRIPYMRVRDGGNWTEWSKITQGLTAADVGALPIAGGIVTGSTEFKTLCIPIGTDPNKRTEIGVGPNDTYLHNTKSDKYLALKDDGRIIYDNKKVLTDIQGSPLWQGFHHMSDTETITPSKPLSQCNNGWVLVWSDFDDGVGPQNWNVCYSHIPKNTIFKGGQNHTFPLSAGENSWAIKTLYIYDTYFKGNKSNREYNGNDVVIRAVLEY
ncbi:BppU family phage baseplate upper protein [Clostridium baratii]|uniref:BppU family phage baseplate upper protein n=1 Tax=Clostridium baratii TaxID=1561 RepID=UPI0029020B9E|nr:BppU family phage baseplate upper protein [Clostridium baratii]MDU1053447.1 BppU family phage baseplate upper protein [Clostridium baratii]